MSLSYSWMTAIVSVAFLAAGCSVESGDDPSLGAPPPAHVLADPNGTVGANGLPPIVYQTNAVTIDGLLKAPLASASSHGITSSTVGTLLQTADGRKLFDDAVSCALPVGDYVAYAVPRTSTTYTFYGRGMLTTAQAWRSQALDTQARLDVHACIAARLNPSETPVSIWLGGQDVSQNTAPTDYAYTEALWAASYGGGPQPVIRVWPAPTWILACENANESLETAAKTRVCGTFPGACLLSVGSLAADCTQDVLGRWTCAGQPAIQTRLRAADWNSIHAQCSL